jgi:hypothetical protein
MDSEKLLWCSVLIRAIQDAAAINLLEPRGTSMSALLQRRAAAWIGSDGNEAGGFLWVCEALSLDPAAVRRRAGQIAAEHSARAKAGKVSKAPRKARILASGERFSVNRENF